MPADWVCEAGHPWSGGDGPPVACPVCGAALKSMPPTLVLSSGPTTAPAPEPTLPLPDQAAPRRAAGVSSVAGYEVLGELGRGGMGVVYKAREPRLNRVVALKMVLSGEHAGPQELARFETEARAVARLSHPNIVRIYAVGESEGRPFLSLEFVDGGSLERRLRDGPLPPPEAAALVATLARAVQHAHDHGVIHRDLKPANVLLEIAPGLPGVDTRPPASRGLYGMPKITDFGLARQLQEDVRQTQSGSIMGTPGYMAPEQACGNIEQIGPPCDVYALGAILYECLTGKPPFQAGTAFDTLMLVLDQEPTPPRRLSASVPRDLETIALKCLEKAPPRRYATAGELADDLERYVAGEPILARPPGPLGRLLRWAGRQPALAATLAALLVFYVNHLLFLTVPALGVTGEGGSFHWFVTALTVTWAAGATGFQRLVRVRGWDVLGVYLWSAMDVALFTLLLWRAEGPKSALVVGYLPLLAAAGLRGRAGLTWLVTGLSAACYLGLVCHAAVWREEKAVAPFQAFIFVLMLAMMGLILHLLLRRGRAAS